MQKKSVRVMSIQTRLMISFISLIIVLLSMADVVLYYQDKNATMAELKEKVCYLANSASLLVDGDLLMRVESSNDMTSDEYIEIRDKMRNFQELTNVTYIYTLSKAGDNQTKFIVDADSEEPAALGDAYDLLDGMTDAFDGTTASNKEPYEDEWGTFLSGYAPIKDSNGNVVAIMSVDISAEIIAQKQYIFLRNILIQLIITVTLFILMTLFICKRIINPVYLLDRKLKELSTSGGDLTKVIEIHTGDEIESLGYSINAFIANIRQIIGKASAISSNVNRYSSTLEKTIHQTTDVLEHNTIAIQTIATGAVNQGSDLDTVMNRIICMNNEVDESNKKMNLINDKVSITESYIDTGIGIVNDLNSKTDGNLKAFGEVYQKIGNLIIDINGISEILKSISNISDQINLLALNASIEAARAGEEGKGFSVVAGEIKNLAAKTAQSVVEADHMIARITDHSESVNSQINIVNTTIEQQKNSVEDTDKAFHGIHNNVSNLIESMNYINATFKSFTASMNEISSAIQTIGHVSQENAAITEELSASSQEQSATMCEIENTVKNLRELCEEMDHTIEKFTI